MILSFLAFIPVVITPTIFLLKKDFQIKMLAFTAGLIQFFLTVGLISKSGYKFKGFQLEEEQSLLYDLGFSYSLALSAASLQFLVLMSALFLIIIYFCLEKLNKKEIIIMLIAQSCCFGAMLTSDLLLYSIFLEFIMMSLIFIGGFDKDKIFNILTLSFTGLFFMLLASTTFSILYESVNLQPSLNFLKLDEMRTPFIRNSLFSTQTVLFLSFTLSLLFKILSVYYMIKSSKAYISLKKIGQSFLFLGVLLFGHYRFTQKLFPEIKAVYLNNKSYEIYLYTMVICLMFLFYVFKISQNKKNGAPLK